MNDAADFLHGDEVVDPDFEGLQVDGDFGDVRRPGIGAVGIPFVLLVVPAQTFGGLVLR